MTIIFQLVLRLGPQAAKTKMPTVPSQITNNIVQRLLTMAHDGQLKVSEDLGGVVKHPIRDALASHDMVRAFVSLWGLSGKCCSM